MAKRRLTARSSPPHTHTRARRALSPAAPARRAKGRGNGGPLLGREDPVPQRGAIRIGLLARRRRRLGVRRGILFLGGAAPGPMRPWRLGGLDRRKRRLACVSAHLFLRRCFLSFLP